MLTRASGSLATPLTAQAPATATLARPKKILVVDDNFIIVKTLSYKLKDAGYTVISALDGGEAVSLARRERPDLILLDIIFPPDVSHGGGVPWDGFLIMNWMRRMEEAKDIPVVVITSGDPAIYKQRALSEGAHSFFHKPIEMQELLDVVHNIFNDEPPKTSAQAA